MVPLMSYSAVSSKTGYLQILCNNSFLKIKKLQ